MIPELKNNFDQIKNATFVSITYISKSSEIAKYLVNCNISYSNALQRDINFLNNLDINKLETNIDIDLLIQAKNELLTSLIESHNKRVNDINIIDETNFIKLNKAIKYNTENENFYVYGLLIKKDVIKKSDEITKVKNSKPLTIAKDSIRSLLRTSKYRLFQIEINQMEIVKFNKKEFKF